MSEQQDGTFRAELAGALAERPRPTPASPFRTTLAEALNERPPADGDPIDLRFRRLLVEALERRPERVVDPREVPEGGARVRPLDASLT